MLLANEICLSGVFVVNADENEKHSSANNTMGRKWAVDMIGISRVLEVRRCRGQGA